MHVPAPETYAEVRIFLSKRRVDRFSTWNMHNPFLEYVSIILGPGIHRWHT
jgi:hypothetical protein